MKIKKLFPFIALLALSTTHFVFAQKGEISESVSTLTKRASVNAIPGTIPTINVQLDNLLKSDFINIRPKGQEVVVSAGTLAKSGELQKGSVLDSMKPGSPLPDNSVLVTSDAVVFSRPDSLDGTIFIDIQIPSQVSINLQINGKLILSGVLEQPISFRNDAVGQGSLNLASVLMRAARPSAKFTSLPDGVSFVPESQLQLVKRTKLKGKTGETIVVRLEIDENGKITRVTPTTGDLIPGIEESLREWQFAPYIVGGKPNRVITIMKITVD